MDFRAQLDHSLWLPNETLSFRSPSMSAWKSGDQVCVALLLVKISAKRGTYVKLTGILAPL